MLHHLRYKPIDRCVMIRLARQEAFEASAGVVRVLMLVTKCLVRRSDSYACAEVPVLSPVDADR